MNSVFSMTGPMQVSTMLGFAAVLVAGILFTAGIVMLCVAKNRRTVLLYILLAFVPLILGVIGTAVGSTMTTSSVRTGNGVTMTSTSTTSHPAWRVGLLGLVCTVPLLIIGAAGLVVIRGGVRAAGGSFHPVGVPGRREVLEKLAAGSITKEQAERMLATSPAPAPMPTAQSSGAGRFWGVLIALGLVLVFVVLAGLLWLMAVPWRAGRVIVGPGQTVEMELRKILPNIETHILIGPPAPAAPAKPPAPTAAPRPAAEQLKAEMETIRTMEVQGALTHERAAALITTLQEQLDALGAPLPEVTDIKGEI
ncbi:MAG: hypothetical protein ABIF71_10010 [Planctomycetota bacterium]